MLVNSNSLSLELFNKLCLCHYFELEVIKAYKQKRIKSPIYSSLGEEAIPVGVSMTNIGYTVFAQHRNISVYLAFGGSPEKLRDELLGLPTGCTGGIGGSPMIQSDNMIGHNGLIGENVPLGVGYSLATNKPVVCFFGDGAAEEDYIMPSIGFAVTHELPVLFVCTDNNLSILTEKCDRRSWNITDIVKGYGISSFDLIDNPWLIAGHLSRISLPALINCRTCRHMWHSGSGNDGPPKYNRFSEIKYDLSSIGLSEKALEIEKKVRGYVTDLWK
jgi:acetoin:2,6-dichlorophenolindophenol oxidoreductase subunit alpha